MLRSSKQFNLPQLEERVLAYWRENNIFERSVAQRKGKQHFKFFEGPPTANARPGIHHVLSRVFKDIILRYKTMRGFFVPRRAGWDTHGLPVELSVEKKLGLKSKHDIETYGIARFNKKCQESVWHYKDEWDRFTERIGYWLDLKHPYITYETPYMESLWWILGEAWQKKLLFRGHSVVPWCIRCSTALSSHEVAQGYREIVDTALYVKFKMHRVKRGAKNEVFFLSWTTTPWTLPGNVALAVGKSIEYAEVSLTGRREHYIIAADRLDAVFSGEQYRVVKRYSGSDLAGCVYEPLFNVRALSSLKSYRVYTADFVTATDGTGIVHTAVMYGEDDYRLGKAVGLPEYHTVGEDGKFTRDVRGFSGCSVKDSETEQKIIDVLKSRSLFFRRESYAHDYPHCWRCGTALIYYARTSWFIRMSSLRDQLIKKNNTINWIPRHFKNGRFGEWLREVKDWNLSRERYWGTPLPVWECVDCKRFDFISSIADMQKRCAGAKNEYWVMRHGTSETQIKQVIDAGEHPYHLTTIGKDEARMSAERLQRTLARSGKAIDLIVASPVTRTRETAKIAAKALGVRQVRFDDRFAEINLSALSGKPNSEYHRLFPTYESRFSGAPEGGESLRDVRSRMWAALEEIEKKHSGKRVLIVSHEYPIWMLLATASGWTETEAVAHYVQRGKRRKDDFIQPAEIIKFDIAALPRDDRGNVNLHRPYVDLVTFPCKQCNQQMRRVPEVIDVWFDAGGMPFAQAHYPFAKKPKTKNQKPKNFEFFYPADYICEAVDQTRGWFYTLLAEATFLGRVAPYRNVISLGHVLDKNGQKMSKSKGNIVDPWAMAEKYGIDAVRWHFYTSGDPGEPGRFDEAEIVRAFRGFHLIAYNSFAFLAMYVRRIPRTVSAKPSNVLDRWILARLNKMFIDVTDALDRYHIDAGAKPLADFINDLSRWYIRRSRKRFSGGTTAQDAASAAAILAFVLREFSKALAPFCPFFAETIYQSLPGVRRGGSVHLEDWPEIDAHSVNKRILDAVSEVRRLANLGLAARINAGIKVRQPLAELRIRNLKRVIQNDAGLLELLCDEVNVKAVISDPKLASEVVLDTKITPVLYEEGMLRELTRFVQQTRQSANYQFGDSIYLTLVLPKAVRIIVENNLAQFRRSVDATRVEFREAISGRFDAVIATEFNGARISIAVRRSS